MKARRKPHFKPGRASGHRHRPPQGGDDVLRIYGIHAVRAALANPRRTTHRIYATPNAMQRLEGEIAATRPEIHNVTPQDLDRLVGEDAVHQGVLIEAAPLPDLGLTDAPEARLILFLDQITDPHNVGAIMRSAVAFGAGAIVMTARHSPPLSGALAKAASGALDILPVLRVANLARALAEAGELGFTRIGLDSGAGHALEELTATERMALVLGAEDRGLRRLTGEHCDMICAIGTFGAIASLNVSNAAAIALHLMAHKMKNRPQA
jgi:23S rRNA (guanosine2251-2'-O)-methyltransferase